MIVARRGPQGTPGRYLPVSRHDYYGRYLNIPGLAAAPQPFGAFAANLLRSVGCPETMPYHTPGGCSATPAPGAVPDPFAHWPKPAARAIPRGETFASAPAALPRFDAPARMSLPLFRTPPPGVFASRRRISGPGRLRIGVRGLGACPDFAPYETPYGSCSNVAPGVDAHEFFTAGGEADERGVISEEAAAAFSPGYSGCPGDYALNPFTSACEPMSAVQLMNMREPMGMQLTRDRATQQTLAAEAERLARERGLTVACSIRENKGPGVTVYGTDCNVGGMPGHSAALLLRPGGYHTAAVESARHGGDSMVGKPAPQLNVPGAVAYRAGPVVYLAPEPPPLPPGAPPIPPELQPVKTTAAAKPPPPSVQAAPPPPPTAGRTASTAPPPGSGPGPAPPPAPAPAGGAETSAGWLPDFSSWLPADIMTDVDSPGPLSRTIEIFGRSIPIWLLAVGGAGGLYVLTRSGGRR